MLREKQKPTGHVDLYIYKILYSVKHGNTITKIPKKINITTIMTLH